MRAPAVADGSLAAACKCSIPVAASNCTAGTLVPAVPAFPLAIIRYREIFAAWLATVPSAVYWRY